MLAAPFRNGNHRCRLRITTTGRGIARRRRLYWVSVKLPYQFWDSHDNCTCAFLFSSPVPLFASLFISLLSFYNYYFIYFRVLGLPLYCRVKSSVCPRLILGMNRNLFSCFSECGTTPNPNPNPHPKNIYMLGTQMKLSCPLREVSPFVLFVCGLFYLGLACFSSENKKCAWCDHGLNLSGSYAKTG